MSTVARRDPADQAKIDASVSIRGSWYRVSA
ncbi:hypothetical protein HMPREF1219_01872 [Corynebacterium pyruviciproducens ATCC BAA-1742]|uniref:Uncharacterized protein n=1 Tax=Corynebacterium pyruviciproducens ATCC BAA-1742 TaxID=1125779 RepID=S2YWL0_9CORY|nr:hypothetical protein HMPREF1219_01872 [Corynebacterium pyruviciproducens ATCC BAA-1742]